MMTPEIPSQNPSQNSSRLLGNNAVFGAFSGTFSWAVFWVFLSCLLFGQVMVQGQDKDGQKPSPKPSPKSGQKAGTKDPLSEFQAFYKGFQSQLALFVKGQPCKQVFKTWQNGQDESHEKVVRLRKKIKDFEITKAVPAAFEYELVFSKAGAVVYHAGGTLAFEDGRACILLLRSKTLKATTGVALKDLKGPYKALAKGTKQLLKCLKQARSARDGPIMSKAFLRKSAPPNLSAEQFNKVYESCQGRWKKIWQRLKTLDYDSVHVKLDDQSSDAVNVRGKRVGRIFGKFVTKIVNGSAGFEFQVNTFKAF